MSLKDRTIFIKKQRFPFFHLRCIFCNFCLQTMCSRFTKLEININDSNLRIQSFKNKKIESSALGFSLWVLILYNECSYGNPLEHENSSVRKVTNSLFYSSFRTHNPIYATINTTKTCIFQCTFTHTARTSNVTSN